MKIRQTVLSFLRRHPYLVKLIRFVREHAPIVLSAGLHLLVVILLTVDFVSTQAKDKVVSVPMFVVDLDKVKVAEMTNLPPKLDKTKKAGASVQKSVKTSSYSKAGASLSRGGSGSGAKSSSGAHLSNDLNKVLTKVTKKQSSKTDEAVASMLNSLKQSGKGGNGGNSKDDDPFKTLLASVDGMKKGMGRADDVPADVNPDEIVTEGVEGGSGGSYMQELSVSEKDLIGLRLRECWNMDAGVRGAQNMIVEIRVFLSKEGRVKDAKILNKKRYNKDSAYRSAAESARRAVYICDKKDEKSPFAIFPKNYEQSYDAWKTLLLRFNPFDGGVG
ncbi:MAG TPA: hypothetical protein DD624_03075 [Alphaproteobacteria bacterium]|nr:hypothetical protein [Alphaproteobacteria bacterium]